MSNTRVVQDEQEWPAIAEALDALGTAADLSVYAQQYDKMQQLSKDKHTLAAAPFSPQLSRALAHVISSGLLLVHQLNSKRLQRVPPRAANCLYCCTETYNHLVAASTKTEHSLGQLRTDMAESGLLPAMTKAASKLRTAVPQITLPTPSAATAAAKSSNSKPQQTVRAAVDDVSTAARDQSCDLSGPTGVPASHLAAAGGSTGSETAAPAAAAGEVATYKMWSMPTASAHPLKSDASVTDQSAAAAAAMADAAGTASSKAAATAAAMVENPYTTICKGLLLLYGHMISPFWDVPAPKFNPLGKQLQEATVALSGMAVALLQQYGNPATPPVPAVATLAPSAEARSTYPLPAAAHASTECSSDWQADPVLLICISMFADMVLILLAHKAYVGGSDAAIANALQLSDDVVQIVLWVAVSAADVLQRQESSSSSRSSESHSDEDEWHSCCSSSSEDGGSSSSPAATAGFLPAAATPTAASLGTCTSGSLPNTGSQSATSTALLPWSCKAAVEKPQQTLLASLAFLLEALHYRSYLVPAAAAATHGGNPSGGPGLHPCKVLKPELVGPLMAAVIDVFVSQPLSALLYMKCVGLIILLGRLMWIQAALVPPEIAAEACISTVRPLVCKLLPHVQQLLHEPAAAEFKPKPAIMQQYMLDMLIDVLLVACTPKLPDSIILELADVFRDQPSLTATTLEAAIRSAAKHRPERLKEGAVTVAVMRLVMHAIYGIPQKQAATGSVPAAAASEQARAAAAAAAADWDILRGCDGSLLVAAAADPQLAQQVFALILSCLKCTKFCNEDFSRPLITAVAAAAAAVALSGDDDIGVLKYFDLAKDLKSFLLYIVHDAATTETTGSVSTNTAAAATAAGLATNSALGDASNAADLRPCIVLAGRSLCALSAQFNRSYWHQIAGTENVPAFQVLGRLVGVVTAVFWCTKLVQWLGDRIAETGLEGQPSAAQQALQDLLGQQQELHSKLQAITSRMKPALDTKDHGTVVTCVRQFLAGPAHDLRQFGALVTSVTGSCANPECQSVSLSSELLKGSKCGSCKVVRYCSVGCQRQHWKLHKPVCARFKASSE